MQRHNTILPWCAAGVSLPVLIHRLLGFYPMSASGDAETWHSGWGLPELGWVEWVSKYIKADIAWGCRRFVIHAPFGRESIAVTAPFDGYLEARSRGPKFLTKDFVKAWRPIAAQGVEVIFYLGALPTDESFTQLLERPYGEDNWMWRIWASIWPIANAGGKVAFDTAATWPRSYPGYWLVGQTRALGLGGYMEGTALPASHAEHWQGFDWLADRRHYWDNIADIAHGGTRRVVSKWAQADDMGDGEGILMITGGGSTVSGETSSNYPDWAPRIVQEDMGAGFSAAPYLHHLIDRMTIEELLGHTADA